MSIEKRVQNDEDSDGEYWLKDDSIDVQQSIVNRIRKCL